MARYRAVCFTSFKENIQYDASAVKYIIMGKEICPKTGKSHLQGYAEFVKQQYFSKVQKLLGDESMHIEHRKGSQKQAIEYCKKEGNFTEYGKPGKPGERNDLKRKLEECTNEYEFNEKYQDTFIRYHKGICNSYRLMRETTQPDWRSVEVYVYWGAAGTGKTRKAVEECNGDYFKLNQTSETVWFDGYRGQKNLIIDDFYGWIKHGMLLALLDGYKYSLPVKGSMEPAVFTRVFITSNKPPSEWYRQGLTPELERRLTKIVEFKAPSKPCVSCVSVDYVFPTN